MIVVETLCSAVLAVLAIVLWSDIIAWDNSEVPDREENDL